ncbi:hypothetical protein J2S43_000415 [Catenuloplanes nepalensis]|uniref:Uncharacterized protein n=1 Tax=Catenuloplanes nepalensis TaxID=587533 RepID=A0ABT9MKF0_9ACTN|nr:hypothetical protein [Catenuloplanes nepalensis]MDP9791903.1 hypothetical protein [Catenuloplanes nepalensis]
MSDQTMVGFGAKQAWLAVRDADPAEIINAMELRDLGPVPWRDGIDLAYLTDDRLVLTPPLPGADAAAWTLVTGRWLLTPAARTALDLADLSESLGTEVQSFATHRVGEVHSWRRAVKGTLTRAFGYIGESGDVTAWHGTPDEAERAAGLPAELDDDTTVVVSERDVLRVAAAWSIDPTGLTGRHAAGPLRAAAAP